MSDLSMRSRIPFSRPFACFVVSKEVRREAALSSRGYPKMRRSFKKRISFILSIILLSVFSVLVIEFNSGVYLWKTYGEDVSLKKPVIMIVGDSFCVSASSFPYLLKKHLSHSYEVINISEAGFGPDHYLMYVRLAARRLGPKLCIVAVNLGNDALDVRGKIEESKIALGSSLSSYHIARRIYTHIKYRAIPRTFKDSTLLNGLLAGAAQRSPDVIMKNLNIAGDDVKTGWLNLEKLIKEMGEASKENNTPLLFVAIPPAAQVSSKYHQMYKTIGFRIDQESEYLTKLQDKLLEITTPLGIPTLDLLPLFKIADSGNMYYENDPHLTAEGHKILTKCLLDYLQESKLITFEREAKIGSI